MTRAVKSGDVLLEESPIALKILPGHGEIAGVRGERGEGTRSNKGAYLDSVGLEYGSFVSCAENGSVEGGGEFYEYARETDRTLLLAGSVWEFGLEGLVLGGFQSVRYEDVYHGGKEEGEVRESRATASVWVNYITTKYIPLVASLLYAARRSGWKGVCFKHPQNIVGFAFKGW